MSSDQLKVYAKNNGVKLKQGKKPEHVATLKKNYPFPITLENFIGEPGQKGTFFFFSIFFLSYSTKGQFPLSTTSMPPTLTW
jgi:hypothetical protein